MGDFANQYAGCAFLAGILVDYRLRGVRRSRENSIGSFGDFGVSRGDIFFVQKDVVRRQREGAQTSYLLPAVAVLAVMMIVRKVAMVEADFAMLLSLCALMFFAHIPLSSPPRFLRRLGIAGSSLLRSRRHNAIRRANTKQKMFLTWRGFFEYSFEI